MRKSPTVPVHWLYMAYVFFLPFTSFALLNVPALGFGVQVSHVLLAVLVFGVVGHLVIRRRPWHRPTPATSWLFVFIGVAALSVLLSARIPPRATYYGETPWIRSLKQLAYLGLACSAYLVPLAVVRKERVALLALRVFVYSAVASAMFGAYQYIALTKGLPYPAFLHNNISTPQGYMQFYEGLKRVSGLTGEPAMFGFYLLGGLAVLMAFQLNGESLTGHRRLERAMIALLVLMLVLSTSFSAFGGALLMAAALVLLGGFKLRRATKVLAFGAGLLGVVALVSWWGGLPHTFVATRLSNSLAGRSYSTNIRVQMGIAAFRMFIDHPILGVGIGNFGFYAPLYTRLAAGRFWEPMSLLPNLLAEFGVLGTIPFLLFVGAIIRDGRAMAEVFHKRGDTLRFSIVLGVAAAFVTLIGVMFVAIPAMIWLNLWFTASTIESLRLVYLPRRMTNPQRAAQLQVE